MFRLPSPMAARLGVLALALLPASAMGITNSLTIRERAGVTTTNYPIQIGRPFIQGEISGFPQALINGVAVATQADVKQRWPDGSVKHAIVSFLIPSLAANSAVTVTFQNQAAGNNSGFLDKPGMLAAPFDFDAKMELTNGVTVSASARAMLNADAYTYWMKGSVATSVILADHTANRAFDIGFDANRSFRPIFHATFWPGVNKVRVRFIGEIANSQALQDQVYSLALRTGLASPAAVYSKSPAFRHWGRARWTKEFWIGGAPSAIDIDHNLAYVEATRFILNYDPAKSIPAATIASEYNAWLSSPHDLFEPGQLNKTMTAGGGRPELAPHPAWTVRWLYSGDYRMKEQTFGHTDLSAAWPVHIREGNSSKFLDRPRAIPGIGRVISISTRPSFDSYVLDFPYTLPEDRVTPVGTLTDGAWIPDAAHQPDFWTPHYVLSGDFWYLEEAWFWASWDESSLVGPAFDLFYGRGPTGAEGGLQGDIRNQAFSLFTRANAAFVSPDGSPEKALLETWMNDAIALQEGVWNLTGSSFQGNSLWTWGRNIRTTGPNETLNGLFPPLFQFRRGEPLFSQPEYGINTAVTKEAISNYEQHYMMLALGRSAELGYPAGKLVSYLARHYVGALTDPTYNPYLIGNGRLPTIRTSDGNYFPTWAELKTGYADEWKNKTSFDANPDYEHAYEHVALSAVSMIRGEPGGAAAWTFMSQLLANQTVFGTNPKWALTARTSAPVTSPCDLNGDGIANVLDVQLFIPRVLGTAACDRGDVNGDGLCTIVDLQRIVNAALGMACVTGP